MAANQIFANVLANFDAFPMVKDYMRGLLYRRNADNQNFYYLGANATPRILELCETINDLKYTIRSEQSLSEFHSNVSSVFG